MSAEADIFRGKLAELLRWEKRKRREQIALALFCYAFLAGLLVIPFHPLLPAGLGRWFVPGLFLVVLGPILWLRQRWRRSDCARALARVDKALSLDERALTAWEILERNETRAPALLVLQEAGEKLKTLDPRALFMRHWSWQARLALPLLALWSGLLWFDVGSHWGDGIRPKAPNTLAQRLREYSRDLQEKARSEGLRESLQVGRELEKVAQQGIDAKTDDERFKAELAGMTKKIAAAEKSAAAPSTFSGAESQQSLKDLKAELEAAQDLVDLSRADEGTREPSQSWLDRLAELPQLKRQFDKDGRAGRKLGQSELKSFLERLEKQVTGELDRRTLLDAQKFLDQLANQGQGEKGESHARAGGKGEQESAGDGEREKSITHLPGKEPGKKTDDFLSLPEFQGGAPTHLKGLLGAGQSGVLALKGKPSPGKSEIGTEEVIASYRRQAEAELSTEGVPETLKEAIRKYFLSLDAGERRK